MLLIIYWIYLKKYKNQEIFFLSFSLSALKNLINLIVLIIISNLKSDKYKSCRVV